MPHGTPGFPRMHRKFVLTRPMTDSIMASLTCRIRSPRAAESSWHLDSKASTSLFTVPEVAMNRRPQVCRLGIFAAVLALSLAAAGQDVLFWHPHLRPHAQLPSSPSHPAVSLGDWSQVAQLVQAPLRFHNFTGFGTSVAIDGDTIVVADVPETGRSVAYVFVKPASGWRSVLATAALDLDPSAVGVFPTVAVSGDTIVVGMSGFEGSPGAAYVFVKPSDGWVDMTPTATLTPRGTSSWFGLSVSIDGDTVVVGEPDVDFHTGAACVFVKPAGGWVNMTPTAVLTASDNHIYDSLGTSVSVSGGTIVAGAPQNYRSTGKAYVYVESSGGWTDMTQTAELTGSHAQPGWAVGAAVSVSGDTVVVGAPEDYLIPSLPGEAYVFVKPAGGWTNMTETARLVAADRLNGDGLGISIQLKGKTLAVGAGFRTRGPNVEAGAVYVFEQPSSGWKDMASSTVLTSSGERRLVELGWSVGLLGNTIIAGAPLINFEGMAFIFQRP